MSCCVPRLCDHLVHFSHLHHSSSFRTCFISTPHVDASPHPLYVSPFLLASPPPLKKVHTLVHDEHARLNDANVVVRLAALQQQAAVGDGQLSGVRIFGE